MGLAKKASKKIQGARTTASNQIAQGSTSSGFDQAMSDTAALTPKRKKKAAPAYDGAMSGMSGISGI